MKLLACTALTAAFLAAAQAQDFGKKRIEVEASFAPASARPGDSVELVVKVTPLDPWHVYGAKEETGLPTSLSVTKTGGLILTGAAAVPDGTKHEIGTLASWWLDQPFEIKQKFAVPAEAAPGAVEVQWKVGYMACTPEFCDPPASTTGSATMTVLAGAPVPGAVTRPTDPDASPAQAPAPSTFSDDRLTIKARFDPPRAKSRGKTTLVLEVTPIPGWHVYGTKETTGDPVGLASIDGKGVRAAGGAQVPEGEPHATGTLTSYWLSEPFEIRQNVEIEPGTPPGPVDVKVTVSYMACTEESCDQTTAIEGSVRLLIEPGEATAEPSNGKGAAGTVPPATQSKSVSGAALSASQAGLLGLLLLLAVGAGLFALVMPCTYPMIPITISFFTKQAAARGGTPLALSLLYGTGIVVMFVLIGVLVGEPIQRFAAEPVFNLIVAALFVVFGVSLLGLINLEPPQALTNIAGKAARRGGYLGVFGMGALLVVTSFTCTAPIIGGLLGGTATLGDQLVSVTRGEIAMAMAVFGLTMAVPFVALSLLPGKLKALPRSGEWMQTLKVFFGFIELAAGLKFLSNADIVWQWRALPRELFLWLWAGMFSVAGLYLLGAIKLKGEDGTIGSGRLVSGLATIMFAAYCVFGALGNPLDFVMTAFAPNYSVTTTASESGAQGGSHKGALAPKHVVIENDHARALAIATKEGKLLFINFTGAT